MKNINNKSITYSLGIMAILTFGVITMPLEASADRAGYVTPYNSTRFDRVSANDRYNTYVGPNTNTSVVTNPYATPTVYSGSSVNSTTAKTSTTTKKVATAKSTAKPAETEGLVAGAVFGSDSFLPSGLIQWIFFAILILLIVILVRKVTGAENKYHSEPLKHA